MVQVTAVDPVVATGARAVALAVLVAATAVLVVVMVALAAAMAAVASATASAEWVACGEVATVPVAFTTLSSVA